MNSQVRLDRFENSWYKPGRSALVRLAWMAASRVFLQSHFPWPYALKRFLLKSFGAAVGAGVVIKPCVTIKYPWNLNIGEHCWIGEGVWIDSLASVRLGSHVCLSQGCMIETGNHDWSDPAFGLIVREVSVEDGAWACVRSLLLPGSCLRSHAVLAAGAVLTGDTEPNGIYAGNPAAKIKTRVLRCK